jgi:hypothetical protein
MVSFSKQFFNPDDDDDGGGADDDHHTTTTTTTTGVVVVIIIHRDGVWVYECHVITPYNLYLKYF